ncbi:MAG: polyprenyl synthetase family protein [Peptococcaceae bacterium]|nr:polyprenyl synthetase family protein [Peptococcaceae bacterium]
MLKDVEAALEEIVDFDDDFIREAALRNIRAGGKRLRPIFVLLTARYFGVKNAEVIKFAAIMELIHMSSLIHDDVNDHSDLRRGQTTLNAQYGNGVAVHVGDVVLIEALKKVFEVSHTKELLDILSKTAVEMSKGEIAQLASLFDVHQDLASYGYRIERKTALLIAICCQTGAILSNATKAQIDAFYRYGHHLGMAFQIKDDLMDIMPASKKIGKPIGHDLINGLINLPTILLLQRDFPEKQRVIDIIQSHFAGGQEDIDYVMSFVLQDDIIAECEAHIMHHISEAKAIVEQFDKNDTRGLLLDAANYVYERSV